MPLDGDYLPSTSDWARKQAELIESSGGTEGLTLHDRPVIVLTTRGAKTGALRKTALMRVEHDGRYAVVASRGGAPTHPQWYFNLVAHPEVELQDGPERHDYVAHEATGAERDEWWSRAVEAFPPYAEYQHKTERTIPVFVLTRA
ncbi:MAG: nitroreductase family deazaflavin-dependent oxidoreductase [Actinomycetales bacterium]|nr:nitroreductase family deazaflavin-dependent oxidoreductase [Actinomycetales bacterium]